MQLLQIRPALHVSAVCNLTGAESAQKNLLNAPRKRTIDLCPRVSHAFPCQCRALGGGLGYESVGGGAVRVGWEGRGRGSGGHVGPAAGAADCADQSG